MLNIYTCKGMFKARVDSIVKGQAIGYKRVSSYDQRDDRQLEGVPLDKVFIDKASGKDTSRPAFIQLCQFVREGDHVFVHSMDRLARNLDDLRSTVRDFASRGIKITFLREALTFTGENSPMSNLLLSVMGAFAEFEREIIKERQREGIELAKRRGVYKGRVRSLSEDQIYLLKQRVIGNPKANKSALAREFKISRQTLYSYLDIEEGKKNDTDA